MTDISIQFHALPEDVTAFAKQCIEDFNLYAVAMKFFPFEAIEVSSEEMGKISGGDKFIWRVGVHPEETKVACKGQYGFLCE